MTYSRKVLSGVRILQVATVYFFHGKIEELSSLGDRPKLYTIRKNSLLVFT